MHRAIGLSLFLLFLIPYYAHCYCINKKIILYNRNTSSVEVYQLSNPAQSIKSSDLLWQSPPLQGGSEVKPINYRGNKAILATTGYGVIIYAYPEKIILFHREISGYPEMIIHSALAMEDGNLLIADSAGFIGILYPGSDQNDIQQAVNQTNWYPLTFAHGLAYDQDYKFVYAGGYTTINKYYYIGTSNTATLQLLTTYDLQNYYLRCAIYKICQENSEWEDGIHDIYPVGGNRTHLFFLTTGERVFLFDTAAQESTLTSNTKKNNLAIALDQYPPFYEIDSQYSQQASQNSNVDKIILQKGGVKSISGNIEENNYCVIAHAAPFFTQELQYNYYNPIVLYAEQKTDIVDYDLTAYNHIQFDPHLQISFYKVRLLPDNF